MPHQITCELDKSRLNRVLSRETVQSLSFAKDYDVKNFIIKMHLYRRDSTQLKSELSRVVAAICAHITSIARRMTRPDPTLLAAGGRSDGCAKTSDSVIG